jgi:hypothetical protein
MAILDLQRHAYRTGLRKSMKGRYRKLTVEQIDEMHQRRAAGERVPEIAKAYGICKTHAYNLTGEAA